jgi:hypothetical protein
MFFNLINDSKNLAMKPNLSTSCNTITAVHARALDAISLSYHLDFQSHTLYNTGMKTTQMLLNNSQTVSNYMQTLFTARFTLMARITRLDRQMDESYSTASQTTQVARSTL